MTSPLSRRQFLSRSTAVGAGTVVAASGLASGESSATQTRDDSLESVVSDAAERALSNYDAGGLTVAVVKDGEVALTEGYGHAYQSESVPVKPDETLFRVGSVSKVATWTAAMQLVDRDKVEGDAPVNDSLDAVEIPQTYDEPITLEHLATHTPGFELRGWGDAVNKPQYVRPLAESVSTNVPGRVRPPGELCQYTNYAAALAGQLVADVSGQQFGSYVTKHVFEPLGMTNSTFRPAPSKLVPASGKAVKDTVSFYSDVAPASGLHTTGNDMARLLQAHLNDGVVDGERILSADAVEEMHKQWYTPHERFDGMAFGLFEESRGDTRLVGHSGAVMDFACEFSLIPEDGTGLFVVAHGTEASSANNEIVDVLLERFAPVETDEKRLTPSGMPERADELGGRYRSVSVTDKTAKDKAIFGYLKRQPIDVRVADDGRVITEQGDSVDEWVEIEPLLFEHVEKDEKILFRTEDGEITHLLQGLGAYEQIGYLQQLSVQGWLAAVATVTTLTGLLWWPAARAWRHVRGGTAPPPSATRARWTAAAGIGGLVLFVAALAASSIVVSGMDRPTLYNRPPAWFDAVFVVPTVGAIVTLVAAGFGARAWYDGEWSLMSRVHYSLVVAATGVIYWLLHYWNLLAV
ncbi:serine hydrolase domain-containing protein [Halogeometricum borinquense]|uniref:serine hydrolase domain-containing protein n=1 Tax=Halogeometricum borinquense TaxID=60847 RepID=UPI001A91BF26|nr:serine hydrolase domain-containing protein [Halogeometricum borinquense]